MKGRWITLSLSFLLAIALLGTALRAVPFARLPFEYDHLLHAHSHTAFQGWIYTAMMLFLVHLFLTKEQIEAGRYALQFRTTAVVVVGVLVTFAMQGYGLYSIICSTLFQLLNYWFILRFFRDARQQPAAISLRWVKTGLWLGLLSTLAPFAIGALSAKGLAGSEAYRSAVYFFLHFQYNGWFQFVAIGLFFKWLEMEAVDFDARRALRFYWLFTLAVVPAYAHSLLGMSFGQWAVVPAAMAALLQMAGLWAFCSLINKGVRAWFLSKNNWLRMFLWIAFLSFLLKYSLQFLSIFPPVQALAFASRHLIVAYLHLCLLGVITCFFVALIFQLQWLQLHYISKIGSLLFLFGFLSSEIVLGISGMGHGDGLLLLLICSAWMAVGAGLLVVGRSGE